MTQDKGILLGLVGSSRGQKRKNVENEGKCSPPDGVPKVPELILGGESWGQPARSHCSPRQCQAQSGCHLSLRSDHPLSTQWSGEAGGPGT